MAVSQKNSKKAPSPTKVKYCRDTKILPKNWFPQSLAMLDGVWGVFYLSFKGVQIIKKRMNASFDN